MNLGRNYCEEKEKLQEEYRELEHAIYVGEDRIAQESQLLDEHRQREETRLENESRMLEEIRLADAALFSQKSQVLRGKLMAARGRLQNERKRFKAERMEGRASEEKGASMFGVFSGRLRTSDLEAEKHLILPLFAATQH